MKAVFLQKFSVLLVRRYWANNDLFWIYILYLWHIFEERYMYPYHSKENILRKYSHLIYEALFILLKGNSYDLLRCLKSSNLEGLMTFKWMAYEVLLSFLQELLWYVCRLVKRKSELFLVMFDSELFHKFCITKDINIHFFPTSRKSLRTPIPHERSSIVQLYLKKSATEKGLSLK